MDNFRCFETIDLEEYIMENTVKTKAIITAKYASGRVEQYHSSLLKGGALSKKEQDRIDELRNFPTVKNVSVEYL